MSKKIKTEFEALKKFEETATAAYNSGKKGRELLKELAKDKPTLEIVGRLEYIPNLAKDDQQECERYYNTLSKDELEIVKMYYDLFKKMEIYVDGEGGESRRDKKFMKFMETHI